MHDEEEEIKRLMARFIDACPTCRTKLYTHNIGVLGHEGSLWLVVIVCQHCRSYKIAAAIRPQVGPKLQPITSVIEEILSHEADYPAELPAEAKVVGVDDVLDMHNFLDRFNGGFAELFRGDEDTR